MRQSCCNPVRAGLVAAIVAGMVCAWGCSGSQRKEAAPAKGTAEPAVPPAPAEPAKPAEPAPSEAPGAAVTPAPPAPQPSTEPPSPPVAIPTQLGLVDVFAEGTPDAVVRAAFRCAVEIGDEGDAFKCYAALNVTDNRDSDISLLHLRTYQWKVFRQRAAAYVVSEKPFTLKVTRRDPEKAPADAKNYKMFIHSRDRDFPAPITLRRESGRWFIYANSL